MDRAENRGLRMGKGGYVSLKMHHKGRGWFTVTWACPEHVIMFMNG